MPLDPAKLTIVHYPAAVLKQRAEPVKDIDETVRAVAQRMIELMRQEGGLGLAAPQIGQSWRMFVTRNANEIDEEGRETSIKSGGRVYINPTLKVTDPQLTDVHEEGCLSLPGIRADILRPKSITITATGIDGKPFTLTSDQFIARVWQHELDHLNGVLIIDKMSPMDRLATRKALKDLEAASKVVVGPGKTIGQGAVR